ncbi:MAG: hypothetical protein RM021_021145 [Nostoc sp. EkiNYC01]|nr:hypothetical protein [Nostoc sp. EkiNYC01]
MLELRPKHWLTTEELRIKNEQLQQAETENQRLKQENLELQKEVGNSIKPDIDSICDRTLNKLKVGRQSAAGKAINAFIKELQQNSKEVKSSPVTAASLINEAYKRYERGGFVHTDVYENAIRRIAVLCGLKVLQSINGKSFWVTPINNQGQKLTTSSNIYGIVEFLKTQPLLEAYTGKWQVGDDLRIRIT